jgi:hypothetical protein
MGPATESCIGMRVITELRGHGIGQSAMGVHGYSGGALQPWTGGGTWRVQVHCDEGIANHIGPEPSQTSARMSAKRRQGSVQASH